MSRLKTPTPFHLMRSSICLLRVTHRLVWRNLARPVTYRHYSKTQVPMAAKTARRKLIVDVDTGVDDAQALMMGLAATSGADVLAITCVAGNTHLDQVVTNTFRVLQACDKMDVPVYKGAAKSLLGTHEDSCYHHGEDGLGNQPDPDPPSPSLAQPQRAATAMIDLVNKYPGEITLVALAPLTNVALAVRLDPDFGSKLKEAIIMGGNIKAHGRVNTCAEFNFYMDPEAARIVLSDLQCPKSLITYEVARGFGLSWEWFDKLMDVDTKKGHFHHKICEYTRKRRKEVLKLAKYISCDPIAMAVALDEPGMVTSRDTQYCTVELHGELTRGQMVVDWNQLLKRDPNVDIITGVNLDRLQQLYEESLK